MESYAITVAEAIRALLSGVLFGAVIFTIVFIIIRKRHEHP